MNVNDIINKCITMNGLSLKSNPKSTELCMELPDGNGRGSMTFFSIFPGITLAYVFINSPTWPAPDISKEAAESRSPLIFNYCINGRCEILYDDDNFVYLKDDEFSITKRPAKKEFTYPLRIYEGLELYIDIDVLSKESSYINDVFKINIEDLNRIYCSIDKIYISKVTENIKNVLLKMWDLYDEDLSQALFKMQIYTLELLKLLLIKEDVMPPKVCTFFTATQVQIAQKTEQIITSDLRIHHTAKKLAESFSISETSLKNYFRGVYGINISLYLREARMNEAAKLLENTKLSISKISDQVGYMNQSKFASVFKDKFNMSPLEYRRKKALEQQFNIF